MTTEQLRELLLEVRRSRGELTPRAVVDEARDARHPLHHRFEWNDEIAGEAYRRSQAAELIRSVKVVYKETPDGEERKIRAFSSVPTVVGYQPTEEVMADDFSRKLLLRELERDIKALRRKYAHLSEFAEMLRDAAG